MGTQKKIKMPERCMNYKVPNDFHRKWKLFAFKQEKSMKAVMMEAMELYFEMNGGAEKAA